MPKAAETQGAPVVATRAGCFLDHIAADPFAHIYELMAMAGLRRGEAAGLRCSDLDLVEGFLVVPSADRPAGRTSAPVRPTR